MEAEQCLFKAAAFGDGCWGSDGQDMAMVIRTADAANAFVFIVCGCSAHMFDSLVEHSDAHTAVCFPSADGFSLLSVEQLVDVFAGYSACRSELSMVDFRTDRSKCCLWTNPLV